MGSGTAMAPHMAFKPKIGTRLLRRNNFRYAITMFIDFGVGEFVVTKEEGNRGTSNLCTPSVLSRLQ
jgi:hypothetical protein